MILLEIDDRGTTVAIARPDGELVHYRPRLLDDRVLELHNEQNGNTYTVRPCSPALWQCDCPDWHYRATKNRPRGCKHSRALAALMQFLYEFRPLIDLVVEKQLMPETPEIQALVEQLSEPFDPREVQFRAGAVNGNRALALAYINARTIQDRLDRILGLANWQDDYECLADGSVVCRLRLRLGGEWVQKTDVGGPSDQSDEGDRRKAAFSDALKRAAVKFGCGRYLYRLPAVWVDYDPRKKQLVKLPTLPAWALPGRAKAGAGATEGTAAPAPAGRVPRNGAELEKRLREWDKRAADRGYLKAGELEGYIRSYGQVDCDMRNQAIAEWPADVIRLCWAELQKRGEQLGAQKKPA